MKKIVAPLMIIICLFSVLVFNTSAVDNNGDDILASGLIFQYDLTIVKKNNTTLTIYGTTDCDPVVVKCGFKNLKVQRRANSSSSWSDYYTYGNEYLDTCFYAIGRDLTVDPGYQYRVTCKHYAKKNLFSTQTISNTSNIITF